MINEETTALTEAPGYVDQVPVPESVLAASDWDDEKWRILGHSHLHMHLK